MPSICQVGWLSPLPTCCPPWLSILQSLTLLSMSHPAISPSPEDDNCKWEFKFPVQAEVVVGAQQARALLAQALPFLLSSPFIFSPRSLIVVSSHMLNTFHHLVPPVILYFLQIKASHKFPLGITFLLFFLAWPWIPGGCRVFINSSLLRKKPSQQSPWKIMLSQSQWFLYAEK